MALERRDTPAQSVQDEASEWMIRIRECPDDPDVRQAFEDWILHKPENRREWEQTCRMWQALGHAPQPIAGKVPRSKKTIGGIAVGGIALCLFMLTVPSLLLRFQAEYQTATAETRVVTLDDGSTVSLAPASAISSDFKNGKREVTVLAGEVFLDVVHDQSRPFRVVAGELNVEVRGTAFDVRLGKESTEVGLARGLVKATGSVANNAIDQTLIPGDIMIVDRASGTLKKDNIDAAEIGGWRSGRLFVVDETIGSVIEQIQRYHPAWISIPDFSLAQQRVTGIYDLNAPDQALGALVDPYGGKVRKVSEYLRVVSRL
ncbi:FecR family protein [Agrobacterium rosae]|uniref:FecR family protein n=1 Tax=Agrobacterium rosae TaxID=1972867 RepID=UPI0019D3ACB6|nr:FecR family protein [Agrobacterium rosae]MBN7809277.1 FecR family protein [Agrobacterium rosae]